MPHTQPPDFANWSPGTTKGFTCSSTEFPFFWTKVISNALLFSLGESSFIGISANHEIYHFQSSSSSSQWEAVETFKKYKKSLCMVHTNWKKGKNNSFPSPSHRIPTPKYLPPHYHLHAWQAARVAIGANTGTG